ncbi:hypothetical protein LSAT2_029904 [Lamellibrachia satsuma]|nr:hypothetical protein LSAT2_029904 [Lamellibrachia satsuma]
MTIPLPLIPEHPPIGAPQTRLSTAHHEPSFFTTNGHSLKSKLSKRRRHNNDRPGRAVAMTTSAFGLRQRCARFHAKTTDLTKRCRRLRKRPIQKDKWTNHN